MDWNQIKKNSKSVWDFIWNDDSIWSWMLNILLAFIIIKFIIYPGIGLLMGTNLPIVAVISESMQHDGAFDKWWSSSASCDQNGALVSCTQEQWYASRGITKDEFLNYSMHNGFNKGDIILLLGTNYDDLKIGDILVYQTKLPYPVIHRIVAKGDVFETKGDHNAQQIENPQVNEKYITTDQIIGKAWVKIPYLGYVKIYFVEAVQCITFNGCTFG